MRPDFGDFRAAFFDLAFSFTPSHGNGADFRSRKWWSKNTARLDTKACARPTHKNQYKSDTVQDISNEVMRRSARRRRYKATLVAVGGLHRNSPASPGYGYLGCSA